MNPSRSRLPAGLELARKGLLQLEQQGGSAFLGCVSQNEQQEPRQQ